MDARSLRNIHLSMAGVVYGLGLSAKIGCVVFTLFFPLCLITKPLKFLSVTPGYLFPPNFWIWTLVTHPFIENNFILLVCSLVVLIINSNIVEGSMGSMRLLLYYGIVCMISAVLSVCFYFVLYMLTFNTEYLFDVHIYGAGGIIGGAFVTLKQAYGDHLIVGSIGLKVNDITLLVMAVLIMCKFMQILRGSYLLSYAFSAMVGWIYLRFYQNHSRGRGDQSENFAFKHFFPKLVQPPIEVISKIVYEFLLKVRICRKTIYRYDVGAPSNITLTLTGVNALDAERRRNKAIKALDERLKNSANPSAVSWPSLNDDIDESRHSDDMQKSSSSQSPVPKQQPSSPDGSTSDIVTLDIETSMQSEDNSMDIKVQKT